MSEYDCVHVGLHKCASTLFQNHIFPKHPDIGLVSGRSSSDNAVHPDDLYKSNTDMNALAGTFDREEAKTALNQAASQFSQHKTIVLSDESYSGDLLTGRNAQIKAKILSLLLDNEVKLIVTIRDQFGYILSAWKEYIRSGGTMGLTDFLTNYHGSPAFTTRFHSIYDKIQYHNYIEKLYNIFGEENVKVMLLEELEEDFPDFVSSIYEFLNVEPISIKNTRERQGLSYSNAKFLRFFNIFCKGSFNQAPLYIFPRSVQSKISSLMMKMTRRRETSKLIVKKALPEQVEVLTDTGIVQKSPIELIEQSNSKLSRLINKDIKEYGYSVTGYGHNTRRPAS